MAAALPLTGCLTATTQPRPDPAARVAPGTTEPLRFGGLSINAMRRGMEIGRYVWDLDCAPPYDRVFWTSGAGMRRGSTIDARFGEVMADTGFDVVGRHGGPDAPSGGDNRARFTVQGELRDIRLELCHRNNWLTGANKGVSGTGSARVDWSVYDARDGRLVHRVATSGVSRQDSGVPQGDILLIEEAFAAAADRLAADPGFRAALRRGGPVGRLASITSASVASSVGFAEAADGTSIVLRPALVPKAGSAAPPPTPALTFRTLAPERDGTDNHAARFSASRIRVGAGYGVVIGEARGEMGWQSVALAQQVEPSDQVTVHPAPGVELSGVVIGRDAASGFALVQIPARLTGAPVRVGGLRVSAPVHVAGSRSRAPAVGIIGGLPFDSQRGIEIIQADLGVGGALSATVEAGDPLFDESGAIVGVSLGPEGISTATPEGLMAFLPIGGIVARLGVNLLGYEADTGVNPPKARGFLSGGRLAEENDEQTILKEKSEKNFTPIPIKENQNRQDSMKETNEIDLSNNINIDSISTGIVKNNDDKNHTNNSETMKSQNIDYPNNKYGKNEIGMDLNIEKSAKQDEKPQTLSYSPSSSFSGKHSGGRRGARLRR